MSRVMTDQKSFRGVLMISSNFPLLHAYLLFICLHVSSNMQCNGEYGAHPTQPLLLVLYKNASSFIHSFIHSVSHSFSHSFTRSFVRSFGVCYSLNYSSSFIYSFIHSFTRSFVHSFSVCYSLNYSSSFIYSVICTVI